MVREMRDYILSSIKFTSVSYSSWEVIISTMVAITLFLFGDLRFVLVIILIVSLFDLITGIIASLVTGSFESKRMLRTVYKMLGYTILISAMHLIFIRLLCESYIPGREETILPEILIQPLRVFPFIIAMLIVLREGASILENLVKAKVIPRSLAVKIAKAFKSVRETLETSGNDIKK